MISRKDPPARSKRQMRSMENKLTGDNISLKRGEHFGKIW